MLHRVHTRAHSTAVPGALTKHNVRYAGMRAPSLDNGIACRVAAQPAGVGASAGSHLAGRDGAELGRQDDLAIAHRDAWQLPVGQPVMHRQGGASMAASHRRQGEGWRSEREPATLSQLAIPSLRHHVKSSGSPSLDVVLQQEVLCHRHLLARRLIHELLLPAGQQGGRLGGTATSSASKRQGGTSMCAGLPGLPLQSHAASPTPPQRASRGTRSGWLS